VPIKLNHAGSGVAAFLLSLSTLLVLENNGYIKLPQVDPQQNEICCVAEYA
jgi:hypothetical protein